MEHGDFVIGCPICRSTQITSNKKGFSGTKAVAGAVITGGIGILAGTIGSNKVKITCLACGNEFKPGEGIRIKFNIEIKSNTKQNHVFISSDVTGEINRIICSDCNTENSLVHKFCKNCGKELDSNDNRIHSKERVKLFACPTCKNLCPKDGKYCPHCKTIVVVPKQGCFIATACYGNYDAPEVLILRNYRDKRLLSTTFGTYLVDFYYCISPSIAKVISNSSLSKYYIRKYFLQPLIRQIQK